MDATIHIYTYKEGLLSKLAHDLRLTVTRFEIDVRGTEVTASLQAASLRVDGVMKDGRLLRDQLSPSDLEKMRDNMLRDVLHASDHPEARFVGRTSSREPPFSLSGELTLAGSTQPLATMLALRGERLIGDLELIPSQWGIRPFRALGGALRVQDRVRLRIDASAEFLQHAGELNPAVQLVWQPAASTTSATRSSLRPGPGS